MIFFDLDGTLLDHEQSVVLAITDFLETKKDIFKDKQIDYIAQWFKLEELNYNKYLTGEISYAEQRIERMKGLFHQVNIELTDDRAKEYFNTFLSLYRSNWKLFDDVLPVIKALQDIPLGIITNGEYEQQSRKLKKTGIDSFFKIFVASSEVGVAKPDKYIFDYACEKARFSPENCIYVGDRIQTDALASQEAGMQGIWLNRKEALPGELKGVKIIKNLHELINL